MLALVAGQPALAAASAAASASAQADAERMERARRLAEHPLRVIQQAGRARRDAAAAPPGPRVPVAVADAAVDAAGAKPEASSAAGTLSQTNALPSPAVRSRRNLVTDDPFVPAADLASAPEPIPVLPEPGGLPPELFRPVLLSRVAPDVPPRVLADLGSVREVLAELRIRPDGAVEDAVLVAPAPYALRRYVLPALKKWRFAPLPRARTWRVSLVFGPAD